MIVKALARKGGDVHLKTQEGLTPVYMAAQGGHAETVELLLNEGVDFNLPTFKGQTPLFAAASEGHTLVVRLLITKGADVNATIRGRLALYTQLRLTDMSMWRNFLSPMVPMSTQGVKKT